MIHPIRLAFGTVCLALAACDGAGSHDITAPHLESEALELSAPSNTWAAKTPIPVAVTLAAAGALSGVIYVVGGRDGSAPATDRVQAYTITTGSWSTRAPLPGKRNRLNGVTAIAGRLYVSGGAENIFAATRSLYRYNPGNNNWVTLAPLPSPVACGAQGAINGQLYVYSPSICGSTHAFYRYDPATNQWTALRTPPSVHARPVAGVIEGLFYLAGGSQPSGKPNLQLHVYSPRTNSWAIRAPLPSLQQDAAGAALKGRLYVAGGADFTESRVRLIPTTRAYNPATNSWTTLAPLRTPRYEAAGTNAGGLVWVIGGNGGPDTATRVEAYTP